MGKMQSSKGRPAACNFGEAWQQAHFLDLLPNRGEAWRILTGLKLGLSFVSLNAARAAVTNELPAHATC